MATYHAAGAIGNFISQSDGIVYMLSTSTYFITPPVTYVTAAARIADLQVAETLARTGATGTAAARDVVFQLVLKDMRNYQNYVQTLADALGSKTNAIAVISASGFRLKVDGVTIKLPLSVKPTNAMGEIILTSKAAQMKALYNWQIGFLDAEGNIKWVDLPSSLKSKTKVTSLTLGVRTFFRNRILTKNGLSGWSVAVTIIPQ
jgi:hypothetical protein